MCGRGRFVQSRKKLFPRPLSSLEFCIQLYWHQIEIQLCFVPDSDQQRCVFVEALGTLHLLWRRDWPSSDAGSHILADGGWVPCSYGWHVRYGCGGKLSGHLWLSSAVSVCVCIVCGVLWVMRVYT